MREREREMQMKRGQLAETLMGQKPFWSLLTGQNVRSTYSEALDIHSKKLTAAEEVLKGT